MRRERLKDQIEEPRVSVFDRIMRALLVLAATAAVCYAFMGVSQAINKNRTAPSGSPSSAGDAELTLTATRDHNFYWNKEGPIPVADFGPRLSAWLKTVKTPRVLIAADESALLVDAMTLLNETRRQGVANARIEARTRPTP